MQHKKGVPTRKISNQGRKRPIKSLCPSLTVWAFPSSKTPFLVKLPKRLGFWYGPWETTDCSINLPIPILLVTWQDTGRSKKQMKSDCIPGKFSIGSISPLPLLPSFLLLQSFLIEDMAFRLHTPASTFSGPMDCVQTLVANKGRQEEKDAYGLGWMASVSQS